MSSVASGLDRRQKTLLGAFLIAQAAIAVYQHGIFFGDLTERAGAAVRSPGAGSSLLLVLGVLASSACWALTVDGTRDARAGARPRALVAGVERFTIAGLATLAVLALAQYACGVSGLGLHAGLSLPLVGLSAIGALAFRAGSRARAASDLAPVRAALSPWDALSAAVLLALAVPAAFPYVHFDARLVWGCRTELFASEGFVAGLAGCKLPNYPPLFSLLLFLGSFDPLFSGRLFAWLGLVLFALFLRVRLARVTGLAAPATAFLLVTVHVWQGSAMYYANVPLMVFLCAGAMLALGVGAAAEPAALERIAAGACLAAAVLVRQDGWIYLLVIVVAAVLTWRPRRAAIPYGAAAAAVLAMLSWSLRPAEARAAGDFFSRGTGEWRTVAESSAVAALKTLGVFFHALQGQLLAHKGFGGAFYLLGTIGLIWWSKRRRGEVRPLSPDARLAGAIFAGSLVAVVACYGLIPFLGDPVEGAQPFVGGYLDCYRHFVRVGLGRMTVHLYPFMVLFGALLLEDVERAA